MKARGVYIARGPHGLLTEVRAIGPNDIIVRQVIGPEGTITTKDIDDARAVLDAVDPWPCPGHLPGGYKLDRAYEPARKLIATRKRPMAPKSTTPRKRVAKQ